MSKAEKLARIAQQENIEIELRRAHEALRSSYVLLEQFNPELYAMAACTIMQIEALQKEVAK
jgi:hypothetical protein